MSETNVRKGLEQGRAKFAYDKALEGSKIKNKKEYKAYVRKIPTLIKTNGLGETFAFVKAKKVKKAEETDKAAFAYYLIYDQTSQWLKEKKLLKPNTDLVEWLVTLDSPTYRAVTNEVISLFKWLSRFSEGLIEGELENEEQD
jgi:CRISPR-associated protein Cmr5